jgi:ubiquinone/menaquinone biosynthesis C-methylase UbiE
VSVSATLVNNSEGYRLWAPTYDESLNPMVALEERGLADSIPRAGRVIDVACGTGRWLKRLRRTAELIVGIDLSPEMLARCDSRSLVRGDALRLPFASASADLVLCSLALSYMTPPRAAVEEMLRVGGTVIVTDVHPEAARRGWKHSFRREGFVYEIENRPYRLSDLPPADEIRELHFGEPERHIFERAAKAGYFDEACRIPAIWMLKWQAR